MVAYRFCRTDDIELLVRAHNHCYLPHDDTISSMTVSSFKRAIREIDVWCSSCMVAWAGDEPLGVLLGGKRAGETLIWRVAVHPAHVRRGHGRHLLESLGQKLAILGPPRVVAEVDLADRRAADFFTACGYEREESFRRFVAGANGVDRDAAVANMALPISFEEAKSASLLTDDTPRTWRRDLATLENLKSELSGWAIASESRIEAFVLIRPADERDRREVVALGHAEDASSALIFTKLMTHLSRSEAPPLVISAISQREVDFSLLVAAGFRDDGGVARFVTNAKPRHAS